MNYRIFSLLVSIIILSHLLLNRIDEIQNENIKYKSNPNSSSPKKIKEDIVQYNIENFESDLDIDDELDYDLDLQYKYRDDNLHIDVPDISAAQNKKGLDQETIENPSLYKWDEQTKSNIYYSDASASQGLRTIKPDMYSPQKNEKIINGGYIDANLGLRPFDDADRGYVAIS